MKKLRVNWKEEVIDMERLLGRIKKGFGNFLERKGGEEEKK